MKNFFSTMLLCKEKIYSMRNRGAAEAYLKVQAFVVSGVYSRNRKAAEIADLSLKGMDAKVLAEHFGLSYETIRSEKRKISDELWKLFPHDFFDLLIDFKKNQKIVDDVLYSLSVYEIKSGNIIFREVLNSVSVLKPKDYLGKTDLSEFDAEIHFLRLYSKFFLEKDLEGINLSKVSYLIDVLDSKKGNLLEKAELLRELNKEV